MTALRWSDELMKMDELYAAQGYVELRMALWVCTSLIGEGDDLQGGGWAYP